ncbi:Ig-like domain-containing protein [Amycolatopsis sulphurea]|uniref:Ig-like domain-containing protein n=1 Tax=Amycolatopsis sulphurea TaxID=76022 RepID=A0A2A9FA35_9PSEU|nr:NBR1-Ig-like domain-containing protein [Amycolatopsis sulphurea]PFG47402.1 Ig-like domain-containing protein [Amycolatopsis sulphurea]
MIRGPGERWLTGQTIRRPPGTLAAELAALRARAGNPSFRKMAGRSGRISHTTLHEAVGGSRFPSWDTTREFARACDADELPWRQRWEELKGLPVAAAQPPAVAESAATAEPSATEPPALHPTEPPVLVPEPRRRPRRKYALAVAAIVTVVLGGVAAFVVPKLGTRSGDISARVSGDNTKFVADVTVPDGTVIHAGETVQKVWEIENSGSVIWHERYLQRMDLPPAPGTCRTPDRVRIGDTAPGEHAMISVSVTAADKPGACWIGWKMADATGTEFFTTRRPVYVLVTVVP